MKCVTSFSVLLKIWLVAGGPVPPIPNEVLTIPTVSNTVALVKNVCIVL